MAEQHSPDALLGQIDEKLSPFGFIRVVGPELDGLLAYLRRLDDEAGAGGPEIAQGDHVWAKIRGSDGEVNQEIWYIRQEDLRELGQTSLSTDSPIHVSRYTFTGGDGVALDDMGISSGHDRDSIATMLNTPDEAFGPREEAPATLRLPFSPPALEGPSPEEGGADQTSSNNFLRRIDAKLTGLGFEKQNDMAAFNQRLNLINHYTGAYIDMDFPRPHFVEGDHIWLRVTRDEGKVREQYWALPASRFPLTEDTHVTFYGAEFKSEHHPDSSNAVRVPEPYPEIFPMNMQVGFVLSSLNEALEILMEPLPEAEPLPQDEDLLRRLGEHMPADYHPVPNPQAFIRNLVREAARFPEDQREALPDPESVTHLWEGGNRISAHFYYINEQPITPQTLMGSFEASFAHTQVSSLVPGGSIRVSEWLARPTFREQTLQAQAARQAIRPTARSLTERLVPRPVRALGRAIANLFRLGR